MSYNDINGKFSGQGLTTKEIAAKIRAHLKKSYPLCKWSVASDSGHISIALMQCPFSPWCDLEDDLVQRRIAYAMERFPLFGHPSYYIEKGHIMTTYYAHLISGDVWTEEDILAYEASDEWARECEEAHGAERTGHSDDIWDSFQELDPSFVHIDKNGIAFYDEAL